jgi:uncharacterized protein (DUF2126 family)
MNNKQAKRLRKIAKEMGYPYRKVKKAYRDGAVTIKKEVR